MAQLAHLKSEWESVGKAFAFSEFEGNGMEEEIREKLEWLESKVKEHEQAIIGLTDQLVLEKLEATALCMSLRDYIALQEIKNGDSGDSIVSFLRHETNLRLREELIETENDLPDLAARLANLRSDLWGSNYSDTDD